MSFIEGTNINPSLTIADKTNYNSYPVSTKAVDTTIILNQLVDSLASQQAGQGTFITKDQPQTISAAHTFSGNVNFTGGLSGISKNEVGLGNVDNTSDINKPISTLQQQALTTLQNSKSNLVGGNVFSGVQTFNSYPVLGGSYTAPTTNLQLVPKKFIDDNCLLIGSSNQTISGTKTFTNIVITGNETNTGNLTIGDALTDLLTINSTTRVNNVNLTPSQFSNIQYLDNTTSNIKTSIDAKTTLSAVQSNNNTWTGSNTFNTLPTTSQVPSTNNDITNKAYVDTKTTLSAVQSNNNNWTGSNTFNILPTTSQVPSSSNQLITKQYCDQSIADLVASAPTTLNTLNELATALGNDSNFSTTMTNLIGTKAGLTSNNSMTGINTYSQLPLTETELTPTDNKQLIPKKYCDDTFVKLGSNNTLTGVQNFNNNVVIGDGVDSDLMTINCNISTNSQIITPSTLSKVRFLSNISADVFTSLANKASLTGNNNYSGQQNFNNNCYIDGFMQLKDNSSLDITNSRQFIHKNYADGQYLNKTTGNTIEGNQLLNGSLIVDGVTLLPVNLKKVMYLSGITYDINTQIEGKASINNENTFNSVNTFKSIPLLFSDLIPSNNKELIPLKFANETYAIKSSNNSYTGVNSFYDSVGIYSNVLVDNKTITPSMLGNTSFLSSVSSNIQDQINQKVSSTSSNFFTEQNSFMSSTFFNDPVTIRDNLILTASNLVNRNIQFLDSTSQTLGQIECDRVTQEMTLSTPQNQNINFKYGSNIIAKINKNGVTDSNDLCTKLYVDGITARGRPTTFFYGNNAQAITPLDLATDQIFIYFNPSTYRELHNITFELSYNVAYGRNTPNQQLTNNNEGTVPNIALWAVYNLVINNYTITQTNYNPTYTLRCVAGNSTIMQYGSNLKPWTLGLNGDRISLVYQLQPTGISNLTTNTRWITNFSISARIISSTTNGTKCLYPDNNGNAIGAYIGLT